MIFILLNWSDNTDILPVMNEDGTPKLFSSEEAALSYAKDNLNFYSKPVEIGP